MQDYSVGLGTRIHTSRKRPNRKPALFLLFVAGAIAAAWGLRRVHLPSWTSSTGASTTIAAGKQAVSENEFLASVQKETDSLGGTVTFYLYDIQSQKSWGINETTVLTAASVNKIPILAALYHQAQDNQVDLERIITLQKDDIQDFGTGSMRYDQPGTPYSIKTLARLMMEKSDNTAAYILGNQILTLDSIQQYINGLGLQQTDMINNKTSAKDMSILLTKMYKGEVTSPALTQEMLGFMDKTDFDDRISAGVKNGVTVFHKTGDEVNKIHDVGIVDLPAQAGLPNHPYYIGVFTTDQTDEEKAKETIRNISKLAYTFMKGR